MEIIEIVLFIVAGFVSGMILVIVMMGKDARTFYKAKIKKKPVAVIHRNDRSREFSVVDKVTPEQWHTKYGYCNTNNESIDLTKGSNIRIGDTYSDVGTIVPSRRAIFASILKRKRKVDNFAVADTSANKSNFKETIFGEMFSWQDFKDFLPIMMNPVYMRAAVERGIRNQLPPVEKKKTDMKGLLLFIIIAVAIVVVLFFLMQSGALNSLFGGAKPPTTPPVNSPTIPVG